MSRTICAGAACAAIICVLLLSIHLAAPAAAAESPATAPAKATGAASFADLIEVIKTEKDPSLVLRAYTKACAIDRLNPQLNSVYMRRMLRLGRPRAAYMSARILVKQDEDAGLAWALIGYMLGRSNKYLDAMTATARALEFNSDDPSILNNAGQLAAWFDNAPAPPKLGDREKRIMDKLKDKFAASQVYQDAYKRVNGVYVKCKAERADLQDKLTAAENKYNKTRTEELTMRAEIARINSGIIEQNKKIKELENDIRKNENLLNVRDEHGRYIYNHRNILAENARLRNDLRAAEKKKSEFRKEGAPLVPKIRIATALGSKLRKDIATHRTDLKGIKPAVLRELRWDPPAVDGVFTAETADLPRKIKPRPKPTTRPGPKVTVSTAESAAAKKLRIAKLYISNKKLDYARKVIMEIFEKYPKTKAAAAAGEVMKSIAPPPID